jgi:hypothetical protein
MVTVSTQAFSANFDIYVPFFTSTPIVVGLLSAEVTTLDSAKNFRMGFYAADTDWQPIGAPLADSGDISTTTTGVKTYTPGTPILLSPGRYVSVVNTDTATAAFRVGRGHLPGSAMQPAMGTSLFAQQFNVSRTHAAFPTPGTAWTASSVGTVPHFHVVFYQVSAP